MRGEQDMLWRLGTEEHCTNLPRLPSWQDILFNWMFMFKYSYRVAHNANPEVFGHINKKHREKILPAKYCGCRAQFSTLDFSLEEQFSVFSFATALPTRSEHVLASPAEVGCWAFLSGMLQMCWWKKQYGSPQRKPWPTAGRWDLFAQPKPTVHQPLLTDPSQQAS